MRQATFTSDSPGTTHRLGFALGSLLEAGDVVLLTGDLGAGKTTFSQGVATGLAVADVVTSPTFTLVAEYEGRVPFVHMDLYRLLETPDVEGALESLGFADYLRGDCVLLIEWPDPVVDELPGALAIHLGYTDPEGNPDGRTLVCEAGEPESAALLAKWVERC